MDNYNARLVARSAIPRAKAPGNAEATAVRVTLREVPRASIQFSGFGNGAELADWLKATLKAVPEPNTTAAVLDGAALLAAIAPATWLLIGEPAALKNIFRSSRTEINDAGVVTDFSDGRNCFLQLEGSPAATVLGKYIDIDFEGGRLAPGRCASTGIHDTAVLVVCHRTDQFEIAVHRSLAPSLADTLMDAAAEFGVSVARMGER